MNPELLAMIKDNAKLAASNQEDLDEMRDRIDKMVLEVRIELNQAKIK